MPRALITGVQGQTGYFLAETLLSQGFEVHGTANIPNDVSPQSGVELHNTDFAVRGSLKDLLKQLQPDVVINLAAISSVAQAWKEPVKAIEINTTSVAEIAEYLSSSTNKTTRVVQASSSEIFGNSVEPLCDETTPLRPTNPYGVSKASSHMLGQAYRDAGYNWSNAILFNHESPRRPINFLSRKVSNGVARIAAGLQDVIELGDLSPRRDWGWAPDYADALSHIALATSADDFVVASGASHSVEEYVIAAFEYVGIQDWKKYVLSNSEFIRPTEVKNSAGNNSKIAQVTGWKPTVTFHEMVGRMVQSDIELVTE